MVRCQAYTAKVVNYDEIRYPSNGEVCIQSEIEYCEHSSTLEGYDRWYLAGYTGQDIDFEYDASTITCANQYGVGYPTPNVLNMVDHKTYHQHQYTNRIIWYKTAACTGWYKVTDGKPLGMTSKRQYWSSNGYSDIYYHSKEGSRVGRAG